MAVKVFFLLCFEAVFSQISYNPNSGGGFPDPHESGRGYDVYDPISSTGIPYDAYGVGPADNLVFNPFCNSFGAWPAVCNDCTPFPLMYDAAMPLTGANSLPPASLSVLSDNYVEGTVSIVGQLPFVTSVSMSGEFPSGGIGSISYICGDNDVTISREGIGAAVLPPDPGVGFMDYSNLYPYNTAFIEDYRRPYTGCTYGPVF